MSLIQVLGRWGQTDLSGFEASLVDTVVPDLYSETLFFVRKREREGAGERPYNCEHGERRRLTVTGLNQVWDHLKGCQCYSFV